MERRDGNGVVSLTMFYELKRLLRMLILEL